MATNRGEYNLRKRTVMFCFGGRKPNLELQLPFIHRILAQNPHVDYHLWNLAKEPDDDAYIRSLRTKGSFKIIHDFRGPDPWTKFNDVYRYYAQPEFRHCRFVKLDDDVVFIQSKDWLRFIESVDANPHAVVSANIINNGACCHIDPLLFSRFKQLGYALLDVHRQPSFAAMSHEYFLDYWAEIIARPDNWVTTQDWLSINFIGYNHAMARKFADLLDTQSPRVIAGRHFRGRDRLGDEGMVNTLPRIIAKGFTVAHLTFGPQERKDPAMFIDLRKRYAEVGKEYLAR